MTPFNSVTRLTIAALGGMFGRDRHRRLAVVLEPGNGKDRPDMIVFRPCGTRRTHRIAVFDAYTIALKRAANRAQLERAREKKERKARSREARRLAAAERRFRGKLNRD